MIKTDELQRRVSELKMLNSKRMGKYRRNFRRYNFTPYSTMENIKDGEIVGYVQDSYSSNSDLTDSPQLNVIKSCIDTLVSKISQSKVRPYFNVVQGSWKDVKVARNSQEFFDLFYDDQKVNSKISLSFRDACIFDTGVLYIDEENKKVERALPWQVYFRPADVTYNYIGRVYYERSDFPTYLIKDYKGTEDYCTYGLYYDLKEQLKVEFVNGKIFKKTPYNKERVPFVLIHYSDPISGNSSQSVVDQLNSIQLTINGIMDKISKASQLNPALTFLVPEGSTIKAGQLNNKVGNVLTYKPLPGMSGSPITVSTPAMIDNQYINVLNDLVQKAYEMVGVTQLSAQGAKPVGVDSAVALRTLENVESERFQVQLSNVINAFVEIAKTCIFVFDKSDEILPKDRNRSSVKWSDVVKESNKMHIQFSAGDSLSKDPETKAKFLMQLAANGIIPSSRVASYLQLPDLENAYSLATNALSAVMTVIDNCIENDIYEVPDFVPLTLLKEEIVNAQLSLFSCGTNGSNDKDIEKLNVLYQTVEELEQEITPDEPEMEVEVEEPNLTNNTNIIEEEQEINGR